MGRGGSGSEARHSLREWERDAVGFDDGGDEVEGGRRGFCSATDLQSGVRGVPWVESGGRSRTGISDAGEYRAEVEEAGHCGVIADGEGSDAGVWFLER